MDSIRHKDLGNCCDHTQMYGLSSGMNSYKLCWYRSCWTCHTYNRVSTIRLGHSRIDYSTMP